MWLHDYSQSDDAQNNPYRQDPFVRVTHLSFVDNLPAWVYPYHEHAGDFELIFILTGSGRLELSGSCVPVSMGSICFIPRSVLHRMNTDEAEGMNYCSISFHAFENVSSELYDFFAGLGVATTHAPFYADYIAGTFRLLFNLHQVNGGVIDATYQSIVLGLLHLFKELFSNQAMLVQLNESHSAADILHYIMECSGVGITLESLAEHFNVSQSHLSRIFCAAYHVSPINYAIHARVTYATEYLLKTDKSVAEISVLVGYDNPAHFINMFTKRIGCTPQEYRSRNRDNPFAKIPSRDIPDPSAGRGTFRG